MANEFSPEEKLLHLIKGKQNSAVPAQSKAVPPAAQAIPQEAGQIAPGSDKVLEEKTHKIPQKIKTAFNANYLILGAFIVLVLLAGYFIFNALIYKEDREVENLKLLIKSFSEREEPGEFEAEKAPTEKKEASNNEKPVSSFEDYQKLLNKKTIFAPPARSSSKAKAIEGPGLRDLVKGLSLVGIIPGDQPQVIIEDKRNGQTLFLKKGEMIDSIRVKDILSGRVILEFNDETVTLSL
jgi:hypothetical protein